MNIDEHCAATLRRLRARSELQRATAADGIKEIISVLSDPARSIEELDVSGLISSMEESAKGDDSRSEGEAENSPAQCADIEA